jgi:hypothetical protein
MISPPLLPRSRGSAIHLQRRRRAAQNNRNVFDLRPLDGDIAAVIARGLILLVAGIVFFIDDDQPQISASAQRRPIGPPPPHPRAPADLLPEPVPLRRRESAVQNRDALESRHEPPDGLRRQAISGTSTSARFPAATLGDALQINFRLPAPGNALQKVDAESPRETRG